MLEAPRPLKLVWLVVTAASLAACAADPAPIPEEQRALDTCFVVDDQPGWHFLGHSPERAEELRAAIVRSGQRPLPEPGDQELWFTHDDGRFFRCVYTGLHDEGTAPICGTTTHTLIPAGSGWAIDTGPIMICNVIRRR